MLVIRSIDYKNLKKRSKCSSYTNLDKITSNLCLSDTKFEGDLAKYAEMY